MKVLITGENGYIGNALEAFLSGYEISRLSLRKTFAEKDFKGFDAVVHAAAKVHKKEKKKDRDEYFEINTELSYKLACGCKNAGVRHFIFLSTMSVFEGGFHIDRQTQPSPKSYYGMSKLLAEQKILGLNEDGFKVAVIRPPMVYGKNCPGNFAKLAKLAQYMLFFPKCANKRSMIYIEHLLIFIKIILDTKEAGVFHPQNEEYAETSNMVKLIRKAGGKKTYLLPGFAFLGRIPVSVFKKLFSDMVYSRKMDDFDYSYCPYSFEETIYLSL